MLRYGGFLLGYMRTCEVSPKISCQDCHPANSLCTTESPQADHHWGRLKSGQNERLSL